MLQGKLSEHLAVVGVADPIVLVDTEKYTDYIDMSLFEQVIFIFALGNVNAKTFDVTIYEAQDSSGTGEQALVTPGSVTKAITQLAADAAANDNDQCVINVRREELNATYTHLRAGMLSQAAQDGPVAMIAIGGNATYNPASDNDLASVVEIIE